MNKSRELVTFIDDTGLVWVSAELSTSRAAAIVKSYARAGIQLQAVGGEL